MTRVMSEMMMVVEEAEFYISYAFLSPRGQ